jgi:hypothetical protein
MNLHPMVGLQKYFSWCSMMGAHYQELIPRLDDKLMWNDPTTSQTFMYMSYWYATLYVVIEGYRELTLQDPEIDALLQSPNVDLLKRYRHGVFHFQKTYFDARYTNFMTPGGDSATWVRALHKAFFRFLGQWFAAHELDGSLKR